MRFLYFKTMLPIIPRPPFIRSVICTVSLWYKFSCGNVLRQHRLFSSTGYLKAPEDVEKWLSTFSKDHIPKETFETSFSRASGPGGQNVNKVNTKVDMRFSLGQAYWLPPEVIGALRNQLPSRVNKKDEYVLSSDRHRVQLKNVDDCLTKLHTAIVQAAQDVIPKVTSVETLKRIEEYKVVEKEKKMKAKEKKSSKKASRRGRDDY
ncbi:hypothetical protein DFS34DRAFT_33769 [Phlyctochytrium arcticum]|nr:hypothetical protein DFS34DRAFT_33769 [Phlyctochytrium arcticum]